jgi:hypothetical protein
MLRVRMTGELAKARTTATTKADPYGMTNKKYDGNGKGNGKSK